MNFLFWNLGKRPIEELLATAVHEHDVDVIVLAECETPVGRLLQSLNQDRSRRYVRADLLPGRVQVFSRLQAGSIQPVRNTPNAVIHRVSPSSGEAFLLVGVHFPSRRHHHPDDLSDLAGRLARTIRNAEKREGHARTLVVGDFNLDPFDRGLAGSEGLHAVMDRRIAQRGSRTMQWLQRPFFYNPMWSRLGDASVGPPGTHYYARSSALALFWHTFDQVLMRPQMIDQFDPMSLAVLTSVGDTSLVDEVGVPDALVGALAAQLPSV